MTFKEQNRSGLEALRRRQENFETLWKEEINDDDDDESLDTEHLNEVSIKRKNHH